MANTVSTLITNLKALISNELGAEHTELKYVLDVAKNKFQGGSKGYGVVPGVLRETDSTLRHITVDQEFEVILTDSFAKPSLDDHAQLNTGISLYDRMEGLYKRMQRDKLGSPAQVMLVGELTANNIEYIDNNVAVLRSVFLVKYRQSL